MRSRLPRTECGVIEHPLVEATWLLSQGDQAGADPADLRGHEVGGIEAPPVGGDGACSSGELRFALSRRLFVDVRTCAATSGVELRFAGRNSLARLAAHLAPRRFLELTASAQKRAGRSVGHCERGAAEERSSTPGL